jgi:hypothetical protein
MKRIYRNAAILLALMLAASALAFGGRMALSVLTGGALAFLSFRWLAAGVDRALGRGGRGRETAVALRYVGRLVLIFLALFAMIHSLFFDVLGALAGLSVFVLAGMLEAVLLLFSRETGKR